MLADRIALSTQSVGVGPGTFHPPDQSLFPKLNVSSLVSGFETSWLDLHACVGFLSLMSFVWISFSHYSAVTSHRRVVIVDYWGFTVLDKFVKPTLPVSEYRTNATGIVPEDLEAGKHGMQAPPQWHASNSLNGFDFPQTTLSLLMKSKRRWECSSPVK